MIFYKITSLSITAKKSILLVSDTIFIITAILFSFSLRHGQIYIPISLFENKITWLILLGPVIAIPIFKYFGLYRVFIRFIGFKSIWSILKAVALYSLIWGLISMLSGAEGFPRSVVLINFMAALISILGSRALARYILIHENTLTKQTKQESDRLTKVLIYGAGIAGRQLASGLTHGEEYEMCGFIDDDISMQGRDLIGYPVKSINEIDAFVKSKKITDVLLAIPSLTRKKRNEILKNLLPLRVRVKTLPSLSLLTKGPSSVDEIKELDIDDLLMRETIIPNDEPLVLITKGKVVMVTGAGGSIGSEICRQVIERGPKIILLLEINEYVLYEIHQELETICTILMGNKKLKTTPVIIPLLGSVQDEVRMTELMQTWNPDILYHAAAYKHVPMVEGNLSEGIKNNVVGTLTLTKVAIEQGLKKFVLISTDKAVNPTNGMGASKRVAELILQAVAAEKSIVFKTVTGSSKRTVNKTHFSMVRFGNVLGSSGSVVPLFRRQIKSGGPITLTHKDITRYFMTISEASQLVMHSAAMEDENKNDSHVYVLDMGEPVKIINLAKRMVELSGLRIKNEELYKGDIELKITGLRPGEKLYEELLIGNNPQKTSNPKILKASEEFIPWNDFRERLQALIIAAENNETELIVDILKELVTGYKPESSITDYIYRAQKNNRILKE